VQLSDPITKLPNIGNSYLNKISKLGIVSINDLLNYFPRVYQDTRLISNISDLTEKDKKYSILATVDDFRNIRIRHGKSIQKATVHDDTESITITWFNQPYLGNTLKTDTQFYFSGKLNPKALLPELTAPVYEKYSDTNINIGRIVPIYQLTEGITSNWLRKRIHELINKIDTIDDFHDNLPTEIIDKYELLDLRKSLLEIHFPTDRGSLIEARKRLSFDELLQIQLKLLKRRKERHRSKAPTINFDDKLINAFYNSLPFKLTPTQVNAIKDIRDDMEKNIPMHRLIQGDVGSGKTVIAFTSALNTLNSNYQTIILAPTSVLAEQHYNLALKLLPNKYKVALVTSTTSKHIKNLPKLDLIIGTHAVLFHKEELIHKLGLIIIDEEHKFGVKQRNMLSEFTNQSEVKPHYLSLTATPIPRSIALTLFGDMDMSKIDKPSERKVCKSLLVPMEKREDSIDWLKNKILIDGGQAFWICPLIDENPELESQSVTNTYKELIQIFNKKDVIFLHGKMKSEEKNKIIEDFKNKKYKILVSTTVIEVGIDIPDANLIIIEDAEKFGLAQLHQLRGRVGRKNQDSWCLLFSKQLNNAEILKRLKFFSSENDGNKIAEFDLQTRGPGEVYGNIQSGIPDLKIARFSNSDLLLKTREAAEIIFSK
jgi:ATP-dependent DNA helicase RecG